MSGNLYEASVMRIAAVREETPDTRTLRLEFADEAARTAFSRAYRVGMFGLYGVPGAGECALCIASPPTRDRYVECTFRRTGRVTAALADREAEQRITLRGPYGNAFPIDDWRGRDVLLVAGGMGLAPLRSVLWNLLDRRKEFGAISLVCGARTAADLLYKDELAEWAKRGDVKVTTTVDPGGETAAWRGKVGLVPAVVEETVPPNLPGRQAGQKGVAAVCGPLGMIKFAMPVLTRLGFAARDVYTTLENRMKCGVGQCGRCNIGGVYVCRDGPVFTLEQLQKMPAGDL